MFWFATVRFTLRQLYDSISPFSGSEKHESKLTRNLGNLGLNLAPQGLHGRAELITGAAIHEKFPRGEAIFQGVHNELHDVFVSALAEDDIESAVVVGEPWAPKSLCLS